MQGHKLNFFSSRTQVSIILPKLKSGDHETNPQGQLCPEALGYVLVTSQSIPAQPAATLMLK